MHKTGVDPAAQMLEQTLSCGTLLDAVPIGIYCCDREGIIRQFNRRAADLWGREPQIGESDERYCGSQKLFWPDGTPLPHHRTPMATVLRTGEPARDKRVIVERPDGTRRTVLVNIDPLRGEDGAVVGAVNCFQDITEYANSHDALQKKTDELEDFFQNAAVGLHIVGGDGRIIRANRAELEMLGYSEEEYVGRHISEFHMDEETIEDILARLSGGEKLDRYPARLRAKDGSVRNVLITSSAYFRDGRFVRTRCFTLDVTQTRLAEERARDGERRFRDVLESMPTPVYTTDPEGRITFYNKAATELTGHEPRLGVDKWCVSWRLFLPDGTPLPHDQCPMAITLREQRAITGDEVLVERPDGSRRRCIPHPTPLFDAQGRITGAVNMLVDITQRYEAEVESAHLAAIVSSSEDAIVSKSLDGTIRSWNTGARRIFGYEAEEMIGQPITRIIPPELHQQEADTLSRLSRCERIEHFETERVAKDGRRIDISLTVSPVHDRTGKVVGASKVGRDISERKRAEELQQLLVGELNHRVKNTLAMVQSIANQTVRLATSPASFAESFKGRIQALAHTHDVLTRNAWQGADVLSLVRDQLLIGGTEEERISLSGPALTLDPQPALHLALVLHELGANARKHGSLSVPSGRLSVDWTVRTGSEGALHLQWQETGGPPVEVPTNVGFGTTLIERSLATHGGEAVISYHAEGLGCDITLPVSEPKHGGGGAYMRTAHLSPGRTAAPASGEPSSSSIAGTRIVVVEDEPLISIDVVSTLSEAGCTVVGPAANMEQALELIAAGGYDMALLDANLNGQTVEELAAALTRKKVPFAFMTGYDRDDLPEAFRQAPVIEKPLTRQDAFAIVGTLAPRKDTVVQMRKKGA